MYGPRSFSELVEQVVDYATTTGLTSKTFQTNDEGKMLDYIHNLVADKDFVVINAGAWTHTSVALRDALSSVSVPYVEVHLTQVHAREPFRHRSLMSSHAKAVFAGYGFEGYHKAVDFVAFHTN